MRLKQIKRFLSVWLSKCRFFSLLMACNKPLMRYFHRGNVDRKYSFAVPVPCGRCAACRRDLISAWSDRCFFESLNYQSPSSFLTLTYNDEHLPADRSVSPADWDKFVDKLRKNLGFRPRYYMSSEYGSSDNMRPHYHAMIFGVDWQQQKQYEAIYKAWSDSKKNPIGFFSVDYLNPSRIRYCIKYMAKEHNQQYLDKISAAGLAPLFHRMSKGIGKQYFLDNIERLRRDHGYYVKGKLRPLPRYYAELLRTIDDDRKPDFAKYERRFFQNGMCWKPQDCLLAYGNWHLFQNDVKDKQMEHLEYLQEQQSGS